MLFLIGWKKFCPLKVCHTVVRLGPFYSKFGLLKRFTNAFPRIPGNRAFLGSKLDDFDVSIVESWTPRLEYFMYKTYAELRLVNIRSFKNKLECQKSWNIAYYTSYIPLRIEELFEIIVDYPDSLKALEDLKVNIFLATTWYFGFFR